MVVDGSGFTEGAEVTASETDTTSQDDEDMQSEEEEEADDDMVTEDLPAVTPKVSNCLVHSQSMH